MSVSALPEENRRSKISVEMNEETLINFVYPDLRPNSQSITRFNCRAAVCLPNDIQECLQIQAATKSGLV